MANPYITVRTLDALDNLLCSGICQVCGVPGGLAMLIPCAHVLCDQHVPPIDPEKAVQGPPCPICGDPIEYTWA
jgi:hypothetical protein